MDAESSSLSEQLRKRARWHSHFWPGAGFALLGHPALACLGTAVIAFMPATLIGLAYLFSPMFVWLFIWSLLIYLCFYVTEQWACRKVPIRCGGETNALSKNLVVLCVVGYAAFLGVLAVCYLNFGVLQLSGPGMTPTLAPGDRLIYKKHIFPEDLKAGHLVLFRTSPDSAWGKGDDLIVARILGTPGDVLTIEDDAYLVNGKRTVPVSPLERFRPCIDIPQAPKSTTVPAGRYFVVQDNSEKSFDSRVLSWANEDKLIGTRAIIMTGTAFAKIVE